MDQNELLRRLESALASPAPRSRLQALMSELLESGLERDDLLVPLQDFRERLARAGQVQQASLIDELIDGFSGWCR
jgi:hypothetical protein